MSLPLRGAPLAIFLATAAIGLFGCDADETVPPPDDPELTYYRDVEPIVQVHCNGCHVVGGIGSIPFDAESVSSLASMVSAQVTAGLMPPWMPSTLGPPLAGERRLTSEQIEIIEAWAAAGAPLGDSADHVDRAPATTFALTDPDVSVKLPVAYSPDASIEDDVRCFVIDLPFTDNAWVRAVRFVVDMKSSVHHIGAATVTPDQAQIARERDALDDRPGYPCPAGIGVDLASGFGAGGPGSDGVEYPEGVGVFVQGGSSVIITMHYYTPQASGTNQSGLELWLSEEPARAIIPHNVFAPTELPCPKGPSDDPANPCSRQYAIEHVDAFEPAVVGAINDYNLRFCDTTLEELTDALWSSPDPEHFIVTTTCEHEVPYDSTAYMVNTHMHVRGASSRIEVEQGSEWVPLLDIPRWDWHWESTYSLAEGFALQQGQRVRITCSFDNAEGAQPMDDLGLPLEPRYVLTGEGRLDEMCGGNLWLTRAPFAGQTHDSPCAEAKAIYDQHCPGFEEVSDNLFMSDECTASRERMALLLQYTPDEDIVRYWCTFPPAPGPGASCFDTVLCASGCELGACSGACAAEASPVDGFWFERLTECAAPICDVEKGDLQAWATCASMACGFELQKCFAMP